MKPSDRIGEIFAVLRTERGSPSGEVEFDYMRAIAKYLDELDEKMFSKEQELHREIIESKFNVK
jgi:hypothetical protein